MIIVNIKYKMIDFFDFFNFICFFIYFGGGYFFFFVFLKLLKKKYIKFEIRIIYIMSNEECK